MNTDILIIGAGPAGLAAAAAAAESGLQIDIIDDNFMSGGQICVAEHTPKATQQH